jgi:hypothetical protein
MYHKKLLTMALAAGFTHPPGAVAILTFDSRQERNRAADLLRLHVRQTAPPAAISAPPLGGHGIVVLSGSTVSTTTVCSAYTETVYQQDTANYDMFVYDCNGVAISTIPVIGPTTSIASTVGGGEAPAVASTTTTSPPVAITSTTTPASAPSRATASAAQSSSQAAATSSEDSYYSAFEATQTSSVTPQSAAAAATPTAPTAASTSPVVVPTPPHGLGKSTVAAIGGAAGVSCHP